MWTPWRSVSEVILDAFTVVAVSCVAGKGVPAPSMGVPAPPGIGVPSLLARVAWRLEPAVGFFVTGGR